MSQTANPDSLSMREQDVLRYVRNNQPPGVVAKDLVGHFDVSKRQINNWLNDLVRRGYLDRKTAGARAVIYYEPASEDSS
jgi:DNA-binding MarR family transcriptional regulator